MKKRNFPNLPTDESEVFNLVRHVNQINEPEYQEPYQVPPRIRFFKNKIILLQQRMDELVEERRNAIKELKKFQEKALVTHEQLQNNLHHINELLREAEAQIKEAYCLLKKEMMHL